MWKSVIYFVMCTSFLWYRNNVGTINFTVCPSLPLYFTFCLTDYHFRGTPFLNLVS